MRLFIIILLIILYYVIFINTLESFTNIIDSKSKYTNIYELAPSIATSLGANHLNEKEAMKKMNNYPKNMYQRPWYSSWSNQSNQMYCFIDKHLNRKCWWAC